jgi:hypothetical protein
MVTGLIIGAIFGACFGMLIGGSLATGKNADDALV